MQGTVSRFVMQLSGQSPEPPFSSCALRPFSSGGAKGEVIRL
jgi:hypothetical protein